MVSLCQRGITYCQKLSLRMSQMLVPTAQSKIASNLLENKEVQRCQFSTSPKLLDENIRHPYKFSVPSPFKDPGPRRHGYRQTIFDGGPLPRGLDTPLKFKKYHPTNSWSRRRALFGQNDYIDILGDGTIRPVDLINAPAWIKGFKGNELQRLIRRLNFEGTKIRQLFPSHYRNMYKRIRYLDKKYNKKRSHKR